MGAWVGVCYLAFVQARSGAPNVSCAAHKLCDSSGGHHGDCSPMALSSVNVLIPRVRSDGCFGTASARSVMASFITVASSGALVPLTVSTCWTFFPSCRMRGSKCAADWGTNLGSFAPDRDAPDWRTSRLTAGCGIWDADGHLMMSGMGDRWMIVGSVFLRA